MRTDYVNAQIAHQWLHKFAPELANEWRIYHSPETRSLADQALHQHPQLDDVVISQTILARTMIDYYELFNVALVNAGIPTPLSPMPSDIRYYTDMDEKVIECSQNIGYNAIRADLSDPYDLQLLKNTDIAIATGVFHFLSDIAFQQVFNNFAKANFRTIIFNHADINNPIPLSVVNQPIQRTTPEITSLLPQGWRIIECASMLDLLGGLEVIGSRLQRLPNIYNIYIAERC